MLLYAVRFKIVVCLVITQNLLNSAAKVDFMKMSISREKARYVSLYTETKSDIQA